MSLRGIMQMFYVCVSSSGHNRTFTQTIFSSYWIIGFKHSQEFAVISSNLFRIPLADDIKEFNDGPSDDGAFRGLDFAFQRSLLNLASIMVSMEYNLFNGQRLYGSQQLCMSFGRLYENRQLYSTPQTRSNIRDRLFGDPKFFVAIVSNALRRCTEKHELWLNFVINCVPYLDR